MDTKPIDNLVAEKLEMIPEVIQVTLHRHDEQFTEAKEAFETGYISEALDALSEAAATSCEERRGRRSHHMKRT